MIQKITEREYFMLCFSEDGNLSKQAWKWFDANLKNPSLNHIRAKLKEKGLPNDDSITMEIYYNTIETCQGTVQRMKHENFRAHWFDVLNKKILCFCRLERKQLATYQHLEDYPISLLDLSTFESSSEFDWVQRDTDAAIKQKLGKVLQSLNEKQRIVLQLKADGHSHQEIGTKLGKSESTIRVYWHRLQQHCMKLWKEFSTIILIFIHGITL